VQLGPEDGVPEQCTLKPEWIKSVQRASIGPWLGTLPDSRWPEVRAALLDVLAL
jgi:mRNA-degrading endonuclease toxin of MazEF toxin-antitoxin module